jgi:YEATS domain-containing protein 4
MWRPPASTQVTFQLHETFATPNRLIAAPPFEVWESGWGEFEIIVHVSPGAGMVVCMGPV